MGNIKPWEELTIQDDYMFKLVMRRKHICKTMIEKILRIKLTDIRYIEEEKTVNPGTRARASGLTFMSRAAERFSRSRCRFVSRTAANWRKGRDIIRR